MYRNDKIKVLEAIAEGRLTRYDLRPPKGSVFIEEDQPETSPATKNSFLLSSLKHSKMPLIRAMSAGLLSAGWGMVCF